MNSAPEMGPTETRGLSPPGFLAFLLRSPGGPADREGIMERRTLTAVCLGLVVLLVGGYMIVRLAGMLQQLQQGG